jgi:FixJ family two-component response regulator
VQDCDASNQVAIHSHPVTKLESTIVVVDDDPSINQALTRLLDAAGFKTVTFSSAEALLETTWAAQAQCLLLDIHLPGLSGFELRRHLVQAGVRAPVIFVTAFDEKSSRQQAERAGAAGYLIKPFSGRLLLDLLAKGLPHPEASS